MTVETPFAPPHSDIADRVRAFIDAHVLPAERRLGVDDHPTPELADQLQVAGRESGLFAPTGSRELGGLGLTTLQQATVLEEAGRSLLGPLALNCAAPDEGNMLLLEKVGDQGQQARFLAPLVRGEIRSCFAMTEPPPGAGSDPDALATTATRVPGGWRLDGEKWFITGAATAAVAIVMARTGPGRAATMFLVETDRDGWQILRQPASLDTAFLGGHSHIKLDGVVVGEDAVLGGVDEGFRYAQVRLGPARLTHCMRWLGIAARSHDVAVQHASERSLFGAQLGELGMAQAAIADNIMDLAASRALVRDAAAALDRGERAAEETSIAKAFVAEAVNRVIDRSVQLCGSRGISHDLPLAKFLREARAFRVYDGPSEVHRMALARRALRSFDQSRGT